MTAPRPLNRMYSESRKSLNPFVGCLHDCVYCRPSFQRQMKRQRKRCMDCYNFTPHFHAGILSKPPPKTEKDEFIFYPSMGDLAFAKLQWLRQMMLYVKDWSDTQFLMQSKDPNRVFRRSIYPEEKPFNLLIGTTIETDLTKFNTPSVYKRYEEISKAPTPFLRAKAKALLDVVTIEPILDFNLKSMTSLLESTDAKIVYVGYDNHNCQLPEPPLAKTLELIDALEKSFEVRKKSIRKAWYEEDAPRRRLENENLP